MKLRMINEQSNPRIDEISNDYYLDKWNHIYDKSSNNYVFDDDQVLLSSMVNDVINSFKNHEDCKVVRNHSRTARTDNEYWSYNSLQYKDFTLLVFNENYNPKRKIGPGWKYNLRFYYWSLIVDKDPENGHKKFNLSVDRLGDRKLMSPSEMHSILEFDIKTINKFFDEVNEVSNM